MAFNTLLFFNISNGQFVRSVAQPSGVPNPKWIFADTKHVVLTFVQDADIAGKVSIVPATGIGLQVAVGQLGEIVYSSVTAPAAVNDVFTFDLPLNTNALQTALTSAGGKSLDCVMEFRTSSGGLPQRYEVQMNISGHVISDALTDTPAPDVAIGVAAANSSFVRKDSPAGDFQIWRSATGARLARVYLGEDGLIKADPIS